MTFVKFSCLLCSVWMFLFFLSAMNTEITVWNMTPNHTVYQGNPTTINCDYNKTTEKGDFTAVLSRNQILCSHIYQHKHWNKQFCKENIRLKWIPETEEISFELLNLQINSSGFYTCFVERLTPPPVVYLGVQRTFIHVIAPPAVSVSCAKGSDGVPTILCTSEMFYPDDLEQAWIRDGEFITFLNTSHTLRNTQYLNINTDGSHSLTSKLYLLTHTPEQVMFCCWVNHSSLKQPITVNISSTECFGDQQQLTGFLIISTIFSAVLIGAVLILVFSCHCLKRRRRRRMTCQQYPVGRLQLTEPEPNSQPLSDVYSTLGNHQPVPCRTNNIPQHPNYNRH